MKSRIIITLDQGTVQSIQVSPCLADNVEVITKVIEEPPNADEPHIAPDENGIRCCWQLWDNRKFDMLTDDIYQLVDQIFPQPYRQK